MGVIEIIGRRFLVVPECVLIGPTEDLERRFAAQLGRDLWRFLAG